MTRNEALSMQHIAEIHRLRKQGWSYKYISRKVPAGEDTIRRIAPYGETTRRDTEPMKDFTDEMIAIGWQIVEKLKREGRWIE